MLLPPTIKYQKYYVSQNYIPLLSTSLCPLQRLPLFESSDKWFHIWKLVFKESSPMNNISRWSSPCVNLWIGVGRITCFRSVECGETDTMWLPKGWDIRSLETDLLETDLLETDLKRPPGFSTTLALGSLLFGAQLPPCEKSRPHGKAMQRQSSQLKVSTNINHQPHEPGVLEIQRSRALMLPADSQPPSALEIPRKLNQVNQ